MSRETMEWLNRNVLVGFTDKRGKAWHAREGSTNHYPGAIPVEDVEKRLFDWEAEERPIYLGEYADVTSDSPRWGEMDYTEVPNKKAILRSDNGHVLGVFADSYEVHPYRQWLLDNVSTLLGDDLQIGTAGLLKGGGQAWVQVEVPETVTGPGGVTFRPFLLAATSLDGSLSSSYGRSVTNTVCDNTMAIAMGESVRTKFKHRKGEKGIQGKIQDVREALDIVFTASDDFAQQLDALLTTPINDSQFLGILHDEIPLPEDPKKAPGAHGIATRKRELIWDMYRFDERVAPWRGNAYGTWQAFNTYRQHESRLNKTTNRVEKNAKALVTGQQDKADFALLEKILVTAS